MTSWERSLGKGGGGRDGSSKHGRGKGGLGGNAHEADVSSDLHLVNVLDHAHLSLDQ